MSEAGDSPTKSRNPRWRRDVRKALGIAFYAGIGWCASMLLPAIDRTTLERAQGVAVCVLLGTGFGLLRAHLDDLVGTAKNEP